MIYLIFYLLTNSEDVSVGEVVAVLRATDPDSGELGKITYTLGNFRLPSQELGHTAQFFIQLSDHTS